VLLQQEYYFNDRGKSVNYHASEAVTASAITGARHSPGTTIWRVTKLHYQDSLILDRCHTVRVVPVLYYGKYGIPLNETKFFDIHPG